ncbi:Hypothetical protein NTJ_00840 [Nesidiocoris tenuis]|uniref:N-acetyltransferase domain-containing protein n=1 Tax=Nesidiocoris tenuis TaxID=355587 RepID=A0ABN7AA57_9HEMI|nr:Hypothetical protein NTJ_00840 [Nesidiocoris tenuis]
MPEVMILGKYEEERKSTGEKIKYVVQTAPPEMAEEIVEHMTKFFLPREPMCSHRLLGDEVSTNSIRELWREAVLSGTTLIALQILDDQKTKLIGVNVTPISEKNPEEKTFEGEAFNEVLESLVDVAKQGDIFGKYNVDKYLTGYGLSVDSDYHGFNVGRRILECRRPLCAKLGISATGTVFTASSSQHIAKNVGFETLAEFVFDEYECNGKKTFAGLPGKMLMMGLKY